MTNTLIHQTKQIVDYYNHIARIYDQSYIDNISQAEDHYISKFLNTYITPQTEILDLGCGTGLGYELVGKNSNRYTGIDISDQMINRAKLKIKSSNAKFLIGDMTCLKQIKKESIDLIISINGSFSHCLNPRLAILEFYRTLKKNGLAFIMCYSKNSIPRLLYKAKKQNSGRIEDYRIRNTISKNKTPAIFYTFKDIEYISPEFYIEKKICLNILLNAYESIFRKKSPQPVHRIIKLFGIENKLPQKIKMFAHAIGVILRK